MPKMRGKLGTWTFPRRKPCPCCSGSTDGGGIPRTTEKLVWRNEIRFDPPTDEPLITAGDLLGYMGSETPKSHGHYHRY